MERTGFSPCDTLRIVLAMNNPALDPNAIHEMLAMTLVVGLLVVAVLVLVYMRTLGRFFEELKVNEPAVWTRVGSPGLTDMMVAPLRNFRKYYAFLPVLRQRAEVGKYRHAASAYLLLRLGLVAALALFLLAGVIAYWVFSQGL